ASLITSAPGGTAGNGKAINRGVVSRDRAAVARQFTGQVLGAVGRNGLIAIREEATVTGARTLAARGTLQAVIVIPADFTARVQANRPASMQGIGHVDAPISTQVARSLAEGPAPDPNPARLSVG